MTFSDEYNNFDLRTRKVASYISTEARVRDLISIKVNLRRKHLRAIADIDELINHLKEWNRKAKQELDAEATQLPLNDSRKSRPGAKRRQKGRGSAAGQKIKRIIGLKHRTGNNLLLLNHTMAKTLPTMPVSLRSPAKTCPIALQR